MAHKRLPLSCLLLAALMASACGPAPAPTAAPLSAAPATAAPPTGVPPTATVAPYTATLPPPTPLPTASAGPGEELLGQAGLWYEPIPGYEVAYSYDRVVLAAPGADPALGPLVAVDSNPFQCYESVAVNLQDAFDRARDCIPWMYSFEEYETTEPLEVQVDDRFGYAADIVGTIAGQEVRLHFIALKPGTMRVLVLIALAPADRYAEVAGPFADMVASIDLLTWTTYSYANNVQDVAFFEGYLWTATSGGVVNYGLGGGLYPEKYTATDGLPANDVRALAVCPVMGEPTLVAGTYGGGLARFDFGLRRWFDMGGAYSEWHSDRVQALACVPERNRLIVGYDDGIDVYDADEVLWTFYPYEAEVPGEVRALVVTPDGETVWAIGWHRLIRITAQGAVEQESPSDVSLSQGALDGAGNLWVGTAEGLARLSPDGEWLLYIAAGGLAQLSPDGAWSRYESEEVADLAVGPVSGLVVAPDGAIWAGSEGQVARFDPQAGQVTAVYTRAEGLGAGWVTRMAVQEDGWIAAGSATGSSVWRDDAWTSYALEDEPLFTNWITAIVQDGGGDIWIGTETAGISRFDPRNPAGRWDNFYGELPDPSIATLYADPDGGVWVGHVGGISHYADGQWRHLADEAPETDGLYAYALAEDAAGQLWIGTDMGLAIWDGQRLSWLTTASGLPSDQVRALLPDGAAMWAGTLGGLTRLEGTAIEAFTTANSSLPDNAVNALAIDSRDQLLVAAGPFLAWRDNAGEFETLLETYDGSAIAAIAAAPNGEHWVTTRDGGAYHLAYYGEGADWVHLPAAAGPPSNSYLAHSVLVDRDGTVWFGGATGGVARYGR